ncbi:MAG: hypothetical protein ABSA73_15525 [Terracidiphilus sp.]|jgi:hypothetical protein
MSTAKLIYTGIRYLSVGDEEEVPLGDGLSLLKPNESLISDDDRSLMNQLQFEDAGKVSRYLVLRYDVPMLPSERMDAIEKAEVTFRSGLSAFQIIKPVETLGLIFRGEDLHRSINVEQVEYRHPTDAGEWARLKRLDIKLLPQVIAMIPRVRAVLEGTSAELKNAVTLLQLGLENYHPLVAGMLWVMGMEAIFDSANRNDFRNKLCACLGPNTLAFPDWNDLTGPLPYVVKDIAVDLYMLQNKLAHGVDLRKAATDRTSPVDLLKTVKIHPDLEDTTYALLLSQAACFLLCQVIQKTI